MEVYLKGRGEEGGNQALGSLERITSLALMPSADNELIDFYRAYFNDYIVIALMLWTKMFSY